jgi:carbonic anhydrase/acetyltransferase-like protein (isoleucine patch superfamily)
MLLEHQGKRPRIHESAYIAPTAVICGDVTIGEDSRVLFGAVIVAEGGPVEIGAQCIIMEQAVVRGTPRYPARLGDHVLVGPHAHLTGCTVEDNVFSLQVLRSLTGPGSARGPKCGSMGSFISRRRFRPMP